MWNNDHMRKHAIGIQRMVNCTRWYVEWTVQGWHMTLIHTCGCNKLGRDEPTLSSPSTLKCYQCLQIERTLEYVPSLTCITQNHNHR